MKAPLYPLGLIGEEAGFIAVFFLGLFFGFFLERAGFGSSKKLTSIFYFKDWSVLRVMFTAIVVAMIGLLYLTGIGWMDGEAVTVKETVLGAQIVGGLLLGAGFIIGGYCPGTSAVAAASGRLDAFAYIGGMFAGTFLFSAAYDWIQPLYHWGGMGVKTLPEVLGLQPGLVAAAVVLIALAAFAATEIWGNPSVESPRVWQIRLTPHSAGAALAVLLAFGLVTGYAMASRPQPVVAQSAPAPAVARPVPAAPAGAVAAPAAGPAPVAAPPGGVKKFRKGKSCS
ncbi:MAG: YeeE/YedE family protein [Bryobacteraceae bacterium]|nr:YeeE/YedE family protein [Bryobacteraceae bacterium]